MSDMAAILEDVRHMERGVCPACGKTLPPPLDRVHQFTCNVACHQAWIAALVDRHGDTREITDAVTGTVYLVPTRVILERGIHAADLPRFPVKGRRSITCSICQRVSYNPHDIAHRYCGFCHRFHDEGCSTGNVSDTKVSQT